MNIFEIASRQKLRFPSAKGELTAEQLWDLPLTSRNGFDLDTTAREVNSQLKAVTEDSFVTTQTNPKGPLLTLQLDIIKHVIAYKMEQADAAVKAAKKADERRRLTEILHQKNDQALHDLSAEQIQKRLAELDS